MIKKIGAAGGIFACVISILTMPVHAYVDSSVASYVFQALIGSILSLLFPILIVVLIVVFIVRYFKNKSSKNDPYPPQNQYQQPNQPATNTPPTMDSIQPQNQEQANDNK